MNDALPIQVQAPSAARGIESTSPASLISGRSGEVSIEFRALLDRLREQAAALERATEKPLGPKELSGAVQEAGASLQGALSIAEGLIEAYRASQVRSEAATTRP